MGKRICKEKPSVETLKEIFSYDEETGDLIWKSPKGRVLQGASCRSERGNGYYQVEVCGKNLLVHRIIWAISTGIWSDKVIDHIDGNKKNNRISNLRCVDQGVNLQNIKTHRSNNKLNLLGVIYV